jgi:hypothetical protein
LAIKEANRDKDARNTDPSDKKSILSDDEATRDDEEGAHAADTAKKSKSHRRSASASRRRQFASTASVPRPKRVSTVLLEAVDLLVPRSRFFGGGRTLAAARHLFSQRRFRRLRDAYRYLRICFQPRYRRGRLRFRSRRASAAVFLPRYKRPAGQYTSEVQAHHCHRELRFCKGNDRASG